VESSPSQATDNRHGKYQQKYFYISLYLNINIYTVCRVIQKRKRAEVQLVPERFE
jgi:hypothetical protein